MSTVDHCYFTPIPPSSSLIFKRPSNQLCFCHGQLSCFKNNKYWAWGLRSPLAVTEDSGAPVTRETRETWGALFALKWVAGVGWQLEMSAVGGWEREVRQVSEACTGAGAHIPASQHWPGGGSFLSITGNVTGNWGFESQVSFTINLWYLDNL